MTNSTALHTPVKMTVLALRLGTHLLALPIETVEEVLQALPIEAVPNCPSHIRGVAFVRGRLIPVFNAAERLGMRDYQRPDEPHIVCLKLHGRVIGVEFDEALDLMELGLDDWLEADQLGVQTGLLRAMVEHGGQIIRLLDPDHLIANDEIDALCRLSNAEEQTPSDEPRSAESRSG